MINSNLGIGPMSPEIIEAVFRYSHYHRRQLMLIASKNQIDYNGGYVNNWSTKEYMVFIKKLKETYKQSDVLLCRDHCGPGFNGKFDLEDTYKTIECDIKEGFDLIHIDFCHFKGKKEEKLEESKKAIQFCQKLNPNILLEVGTDENLGTNYSLPNLNEIEEEIDFFKNFCSPEFYVVQTGSLVKEINQVGNFNQLFIENIKKMMDQKGVKLKEHNADYLSKSEIDKRENFIHAFNIAPQMGVIQTQLILNKCLIYGINFDAFVEEVYAGKKWVKWLQNNKPENKFLCAVIAGHYHFANLNYQELLNKLAEHEEIHETIINTIMEVIQHYGK